MPSNEYKAILELLDSMPDTSGMTFEERRADFEQQVSLLPVAEGVSSEPVSAGGIPAEQNRIHAFTGLRIDIVRIYG